MTIIQRGSTFDLYLGGWLIFAGLDLETAFVLGGYDVR